MNSIAETGRSIMTACHVNHGPTYTRSRNIRGNAIRHNADIAKTISTFSLTKGNQAMELDITHMITDADDMPMLSGSRAELGQDAGSITWNNSKACEHLRA